MKQILLALTLAVTAIAPGMAAEPRCQSSDDRSCTQANGRSDAARVLAQGKLALMVWGGPAAPQPEMDILMDEYKRAGIEVWLIGDTMPSPAQNKYYEGFNTTMEKAIAAKRGPDYMKKFFDRVKERTRHAQTAVRDR